MTDCGTEAVDTDRACRWRDRRRAGRSDVRSARTQT